MARTPKPPTPTNVSATLRAADYRAIGNGDEGYEVTSEGESAVRVEFWVNDDESDYGSTEGNERVIELHDRAIAGMERVLRRKGWRVERHGFSAPFLLVSAA